MAPSCNGSIKIDGASSEIIPSPMEKSLHGSGVGICNQGHPARRIIRAPRLLCAAPSFTTAADVF
jgi:hypothetical protein